MRPLGGLGIGGKSSYQVCNFHFHYIRWVAKVYEDAVTHVLRYKTAVSESYFPAASFVVHNALWTG